MGKYEAVADFITFRDGGFVEAVEIDDSRPRVFVFHGALSTNIKDAETVLKSAMDLFEDMGIEGYDFYSTYYTRKTLLGFLKYQRATEKERDAIREEFKQATVEVFNDIFMPLVQKGGKIYSKEQIIENLDKVIFRGHCMGSLLITNLGNLFHDKLKELGFGEADIDEITSHGRLIFSSSIVLPHEIEGKYKVFSFINLGDNELFKYAGEDWRANLMYLTGAKKQPDEPIVSTLQANNIRFVLLSSHLDNTTKTELEAEVKQAIEAGDKEKVRKLEKVLLGHAWSLIARPYKEFGGVKKAYEMFKEMVGEALRNQDI